MNKYTITAPGIRGASVISAANDAQALTKARKRYGAKATATRQAVKSESGTRQCTPKATPTKKAFR